MSIDFTLDFVIIRAFFGRGEALLCHSALFFFVYGSYLNIQLSSPVITLPSVPSHQKPPEKTSPRNDQDGPSRLDKASKQPGRCRYHVPQNSNLFTISGLLHLRTGFPFLEPSTFTGKFYVLDAERKFVITEIDEAQMKKLVAFYGNDLQCSEMEAIRKLHLWYERVRELHNGYERNALKKSYELLCCLQRRNTPDN